MRERNKFIINLNKNKLLDKILFVQLLLIVNTDKGCTDLEVFVINLKKRFKNIAEKTKMYLN